MVESCVGVPRTVSNFNQGAGRAPQPSAVKVTRILVMPARRAQLHHAVQVMSEAGAVCGLVTEPRKGRPDAGQRKKPSRGNKDGTSFVLSIRFIVWGRCEEKHRRRSAPRKPSELHPQRLTAFAHAHWRASRVQQHARRKS